MWHVLFETNYDKLYKRKKSVELILNFIAVFLFDRRFLFSFLYVKGIRILTKWR